MRHMYVLLALAVLAGLAAAGNFDAKIDTDTYVDNDSPDDAFDEEEVLWATSMDGEPVRETYIGFINTFGAVGVFNPENVESATLKVYASEVEESGEVTAYLLKGATLSTWTWNDKDEYEDEPSVTFEVEDVGEYEVDVTPLVQMAVEICTEGCPYSIVLVADEDTSVAFSSSEGDEEPSLEYSTEE